jgi:hypothetical protein
MGQGVSHINGGRLGYPIQKPNISQLKIYEDYAKYPT